MNIEQKKNLAIFILIIFFAFQLGRNVIYKNNLSKTNSIKEETAEEKKKNEILGIIGILDKKLQAYRKRSFPTSEVTPLLDRISELVKQVGIEIESFSLLTIVSREQYIELPVKITIECKYHRLGKLLALLESSQEFIWVKELQMKKSAQADPEKEGIAKIDLSVSGIYLKE